MGRGKELTPHMRGQIEGMHKSGKTNSEIARALHQNVKMVASTLRLTPLRSDGISRPRPGQP